MSLKRCIWKHFEAMYEKACAITAAMEQSGCMQIYEKNVAENRMMHGDYNYHNILILPGDTAITNFEHMRIGIQVQDLYYFLRKAMENIVGNRNWGLGSSGRMKDNAGWSRENGSIWGFNLPILRSSGRLPAVIAGRIRHGCLKKVWRSWNLR